jgi:hypothetical protein
VVPYIDMAEYSRGSLWCLEASFGTHQIPHSSSWYPWGILVVKRRAGVECILLNDGPWRLRRP